MLTISLPEDVESHLRTVAAEAGQSPEECAGEVLQRFLEDHEDLADALAALEEYRRHPDQVWTMDEVLTECGLTRDDLR